MTFARGLTWNAIPEPMPIKKSRFQVCGSNNIRKFGTMYPNKRQSTAITSILELSVLHLRKQLEELKLLCEDWDGYGAPAISHMAIKKCDSTLSYIKPELCSRIKILPNEWGGVQLQFNAKNGRICCDYGDESMSYFVERADGGLEWHSYESYDESNIEIFAESLMSVR